MLTTIKFWERPVLRPAALGGLWLCSGLVYYAVFVRPYGLAEHLQVPQFAFAAEADRKPGPAASFVLGFLLLFALYALAYKVSRNWRSPAAAVAVVLGGLALAILMIPAYPIGANDVFDYMAAGELLTLYGLNPMVHPIGQAPNLPLIERVAWPGHVSYYGPAWTWIESGVIRVVGKPDVMLLVLGFKIMAILAYLAVCLLMVLFLRYRSSEQIVSGVLVFAWSPLVLFEVAVNAHNDIWAGGLLLAGAFLWERRWLLPMFAVLTLAPLFKAPVAVLLPLFALAAWRSESSVGRRRPLVGGALTVLGVPAVFYLTLPEGMTSITTLQKLGAFFSHSLPAVVKLSLQLAMPVDLAAGIVHWAIFVVLGAYVLLQLRAVYRTPMEVVLRSFNTLLFLLLVCLPWFQPWYLLWILPLSAIYPRPNAPFQAALFALCATWSYIVYGFVWFWMYPVGNWGNSLVINLVALVTTYALPWICAVFSGRRREIRSAAF